MTIGTFCLLKNEGKWIGPHIMRVLDYIDEMVFFDGGSTDGTLEIIKHIQCCLDRDHKVRLFRDKDPRDLREDYTRLSNECMRTLTTDLAWFLHPDMWVINPNRINEVKKSPETALWTNVSSFAGEPDGPLLAVVSGRVQRWKNIYRLHNPDLGAHYHGLYGSADEDIYFSAITGESHEFYGDYFDQYPYHVGASDIDVMHFSDVRPYSRRLSRMVECLKNQGMEHTAALERAEKHPRVNLEPDDAFSFMDSEYPPAFIKWREYFRKLKCPQIAHI